MQSENSSSGESSELRTPPRRRGLIWVSLVLCVLSWSLVTFQPDSLAWLMIFPRWTWLVCGVVLVVYGAIKSQSRRWLAVVLLWGVYAIFAVDESKPLARSLFRRSSESGPASNQIRVVTFNCGSGSAAAAEEAFQQKPDLILFQESPPQQTLERFAAEQWGSNADVVWGPDASIVAGGKLTLRRRSSRGVWIWATWRRDNEEIEVVSLRLAPVPLRFDCWSLECWRALRGVRERHRQEIAEILGALGEAPGTRRCLIGGDFNAPARDASLTELNQAFRDAFGEAGVRWGDTIINEFPVQRIDQIWINRRLQPIDAAAVRSRHSDHRLVVADFRLP